MTDSGGSPPKEMHPTEAKKLAGKLSSDLFDMVRLQGKVTPAGPAVMASDEGGGDYATQHVWSISRLSSQELTRGFYRLREELPKKGWRITHFGRASSAARQQEMEAVRKKDGYSLSVELWVKSSEKIDGHVVGPKSERILFSVGSPTYRSPKGVDPNDY
ncbi:hypothetical protein [Streptomyces himastatinicus]|uniref:hypothetical protein n=1 Tax=Streptomyces himastatinicus TaxID=998084 RepID=UPI0012B691DD|nr:hypothetical protein [Streptomyces himastatinicus]